MNAKDFMDKFFDGDDEIAINWLKANVLDKSVLGFFNAEVATSTAIFIGVVYYSRQRTESIEEFVRLHFGDSEYVDLIVSFCTNHIDSHRLASRDAVEVMPDDAESPHALISFVKDSNPLLKSEEVMKALVEKNAKVVVDAMAALIGVALRESYHVNEEGFARSYKNLIDYVSERYSFITDATRELQPGRLEEYIDAILSVAESAGIVFIRHYINRRTYIADLEEVIKGMHSPDATSPEVMMNRASHMIMHECLESIMALRGEIGKFASKSARGGRQNLDEAVNKAITFLSERDISGKVSFGSN